MISVVKHATNMTVMARRATNQRITISDTISSANQETLIKDSSKSSSSPTFSKSHPSAKELALHSTILLQHHTSLSGHSSSIASTTLASDPK